MTGSGCSSGRGAGWSATRRCATPCNGPTTCSTMPKRRCWQGVRSSPAASTWPAPARSPAPTTSSPSLDLLDALVRKSLLVADRSSERTRFSMLETIRQFAEEQLVHTGAPTTPAPRTPATSRSGKPTCSRCGTVRDNARPTLVHRRAGEPAHRVPVGRRPRRSRHRRRHRLLRGFLGIWVEQYEPVAWAEELIEPARAVDHRRLAQLYVDGGAVLRGRPGRRLRRLCRQRPARHRKRAFRRGSVRFRSCARRYVHHGRSSPTVG